MRRRLTKRHFRDSHRPVNLRSAGHRGNWYRTNGERLHKIEIINEIRKTETRKNEHKEPEQKKKSTWKRAILRLAGYAALGIAAGKFLGYTMAHLGTLGSVAIVAGICAVVIATTVILGKTSKKAKHAERTGLAFGVDMLAGKAVYVAGVGALGYMSKFVHDPLSGLAVGAASVLVAYISGIITFYSLWGISNIRKYSKTGFGRLSDLKKIPPNIKEGAKAMKSAIKGEPIGDKKGVKAESFLSESAEIHGKAIVFNSPFYAFQIAAGFIAGFAPASFIEVFTAIFATASPYYLPFYMNFYRAIGQRVKSVVEEQPLKRNP
jgi:F0F1-type ATP synthase assembly protein I